MKQKRLCIFDLDGTLVNSLDDLADAVNQGLRALGCPVHPADAYRQMVGNGAWILCQRALPPNASDDMTDKLYGLFSAYYDAHALDQTVPYTGIPTLLEALRADGVLLAVATNKPQEFAQQIIHHFFGDQLFCQIHGGCGKPNPDAICSILQAAQTAPEDAVLLGDSNVDILTAKNAGIDSIGCCWGFRTEQELRDTGAAYLIHTPMDALKILRG